MGEPTASEQWRYFRVKSESTVLGNKVHAEAREVGWLGKWRPGKFFRMPATVSLVSSGEYQQGEVFGLDAASAAAVWALECEKSHHVLDLCCAPGGKAFLIAEEAAEVVGVDVALHRLCTTRALAKKYKIGNLTLMHGSGIEKPAAWTLLPMDKKRKQLTTAAEHQTRLFDRVLVDAECTHDASTRHVVKQTKLHGHFRSPWEGRENELFELQVALLLNACDLVKPGGIVVYSTCSSKTVQNELVVQEALKRLPSSSLHFSLDPLPFRPEDCAGAESRRIPGHSDDTAAAFFDPDVTGTSGLFLCRLRRSL